MRASGIRRLAESGDRVMRHDPARVDDRGPHEAAIHLGAVAKLRDVAGRRRQPLDESLLEAAAAEVVEYWSVIAAYRRICTGSSAEIRRRTSRRRCT